MFSDYLHEMTTKWGFNDGELVPRDAEAARNVMVKIIAAWLKQNHPDHKVVKYNRPGFHNWCLILFKKGKDEWVDPPSEIYSFLADQLDNRFNELVPVRVGKIDDRKVKAAIKLALKAA